MTGCGRRRLIDPVDQGFAVEIVCVLWLVCAARLWAEESPRPSCVEGGMCLTYRRFCEIGWLHCVV